MCSSKSTVVAAACLSLTALWLLSACGNSETSGEESEQNISLTIAHFWSEPAQKQMLRQLLDEYEVANPQVKVELLDLNWSDGKTKLQLAFNSNSPPDIIHLGLEWTAEFARAGVLAALPADKISVGDLGTFLPQALGALRQGEEKLLYALPWFVNTRCMLLNMSANNEQFTNQGTELTWQDLDTFMATAASYTQVPFGVNAAEPHNVLKKSLPVIWSAGSELFTALPLHETFDEAALDGLARYCQMAAGGQIETSRILDDMFIDGQLAVWISGAWLEPMLTRDLDLHHVRVLGSFPSATDNTARGWSILGGDALAVSAGSPNGNESWRLVQYLSSYAAAKSFSTAVPDAGLPAHRRALLDADFRSNAFRAGFVDQIANARPLPASPVFLEAQAILEQAIMQAVYGRLTPVEALEAARQRVKRLEEN